MNIQACQDTIQDIYKRQ